MPIDDIDDVLTRRKHAPGALQQQQQLNAIGQNPPGVTRIPEAKSAQAPCEPTDARDTAPTPASTAAPGAPEDSSTCEGPDNSTLDSLASLLSGAKSLPNGPQPSGPEAPDDTAGPAGAESGKEAGKGKGAKKHGGGESGVLREIDTPTEILLVDEKGNVVSTLPKPHLDPKDVKDTKISDDLSGSQGAATQAASQNQPRSPLEVAAQETNKIKRIQ